MKKLLSRALALVCAAALLYTAAFALTTDQLALLLRRNYAEDVPKGVWLETTVDGMMEALGDPYSRLLTAQEVKACQEASSAEDPAAPSVKVSLEGRVCVLTVPAYTDETAALVRHAVGENDRKADCWLLDLRGNVSDDIACGADVAAVFAGSAGNAVYLRDNLGRVTQYTSETAIMTVDPVIVLVDEKTTGAAELTAGTIRDSRSGLVIGCRTAGKGTVQGLFTNETHEGMFPDGGGLLLSDHRFFSSGFNSNNVMGVLPHLAVEADMVLPVARLLTGTLPTGNNYTDWLQVRLGGWKWYVDMKTADSAAVKAMVEALPPTATVEIGSLNGWTVMDAARYGAGHVAGYVGRAFPDVDKSPYQDAINTLKVYGVLKGDEFGNFNPKNTMDRATLCALLAQAMNYPKSTGAPAFDDTPANAWYTPYVTTLSAMGIINGYDDGDFHPNDPIPHQQFMAILSRIVAYTNHMSAAAFELGPTEEELERGTFSAYDGWAVSGAWLLDGLWHESTDQIDPKAPTTREEAAYDLWSALTNLGILPE